MKYCKFMIKNDQEHLNDSISFVLIKSWNYYNNTQTRVEKFQLMNSKKPVSEMERKGNSGDIEYVQFVTANRKKTNGKIMIVGYRNQ